MDTRAEDIREEKNRKNKWASNRYFKDYDEYYVPKGNKGKYKIVRVFNGECFQADLSDSQRRGRKTLYLAGWFLALVLLLYISTRPWSCNSTWYVVLPMAISLASLCWLFLGIFHFIITGAELPDPDYRSSSITVIHASRIAGVSLLCTAVMMIVFLILHKGAEFNILIGLFGYLVATVIIILIEKVEENTEYHEYKSERTPPEGGVLIRK